MTIDQQNQIDAYLTGQMSGPEQAAFEKELAGNPAMQQEVNFQSEVIKGITNYRKLQLKAQLDTVPVSAGWWSVFQHASLTQWVIGTLSIGLVGAGVYWYLTKPVENAPKNEIAVDSTLTSPEILEIVEIPTKENGTDEQPSTTETSKVENQSESDNTQSEKAADRPEKAAAKKNFNPNVPVPKAGNGNEGDTFSPDQLPKPEEDVRKKSTEEPLDVEVISSRGSKVKYRYYAGKLYLYGNFENNPYEIVEINSAKGRRIYLYHMDTYYEIVPADKATSATIVTDAALINELSILRKAK